MRACGRQAIDGATSRAHSINRSTTGLKVRPFSVTIATRNDRAGRSTGKAFKEYRSASERGIDYEVRDRKLVINKTEAASVRTIFERFASIGSMTKLIPILAKEGIKAKSGKPADKGYLYG